MDNKTTETSERTYIYSGRVGYGRAGQGGVWQDRRKVGVGWGESGRVHVGVGGWDGVKWCGAGRGGVGSGLGSGFG